MRVTKSVLTLVIKARIDLRIYETKDLKGTTFIDYAKITVNMLGNVFGA